MIKRLEKKHIQQIRSCISISSLSQCVVELVHNSLDANARNIDIRLAGFDITVKDDGHGIPAGDFSFLGVKYASSKLGEGFGFRGEGFFYFIHLF